MKQVPEMPNEGQFVALVQHGGKVTAKTLKWWSDGKLRESIGAYDVVVAQPEALRRAFNFSGAIFFIPD